MAKKTRSGKPASASPHSDGPTGNRPVYFRMDKDTLETDGFEISLMAPREELDWALAQIEGAIRFLEQMKARRARGGSGAVNGAGRAGPSE